MRDKKLLILICSICLVLVALPVLAACPAPKEIKPVILKLATPLPPGTIPGNLAEEWAERFNEAAEGRYIMEVHPMLLGIPEMLPSVRGGSVEMGSGSFGEWGTLDARLSAPSVPFLTDTFDANHACWLCVGEQVFGPVLEEKFNVKLLACEDYGFKDVYGMKPIKTMEDWEGKLVATQDPVDTKYVKALGGTPCDIPWTDELMSLEKGVVDLGVSTCWAALVDIKFYEVIKYATAASIKGTSGGYFINLDVFNAMPKDIQKLIVDEAKRFERELYEAQKASDAKAIDELQRQGVEVYFLPDTERARWREASSSVADDYWALIGPDVAKTIQDCAAEANKQFPR
jgi:TRAP-type C4-dicarboxylate transport system substrate-binding protein